MKTLMEMLSRLTTKGDPTNDDQFHVGISVEEKVVFIGRIDRDNSKEFVHNLININN